ncbi:MAG: helix-turn-helix transcriptional regulator [Candidatus Microsaccharimonas sp.]
MNDPRLIGSRVKQLRKRKGLSQTELGKKVNKSAMQISYIETGERSATSDILEKLASALEVTVGDFIAPVVVPKISTITYGRMSSHLTSQQRSEVERALQEFDTHVRSEVL